MNKVIIEANVLNALLECIMNAVHPNRTTLQVNQFVNGVRQAVKPFVDEKAAVNKNKGNAAAVPAVDEKTAVNKNNGNAAAVPAVDVKEADTPPATDEPAAE